MVFYCISRGGKYINLSPNKQASRNGYNYRPCEDYVTRKPSSSMQLESSRGEKYAPDVCSQRVLSSATTITHQTACRLPKLVCLQRGGGSGGGACAPITSVVHLCAEWFRPISRRHDRWFNATAATITTWSRRAGERTGVKGGWWKMVISEKCRHTTAWDNDTLKRS